MALIPLASVSDLAEYLGETIPEEDPRALSYLRIASVLVRSHTGRTGTEDWAEEGDVPDEANVVTVMIAARVWNNPTNVSQHSETIGRWNESQSFRPPDGFFLTATEKSILGRFSGRLGLWALPTTRTDGAEPGDIYAPVSGGGDDIPMILENPS